MRLLFYLFLASYFDFAYMGPWLQKEKISAHSKIPFLSFGIESFCYSFKGDFVKIPPPHPPHTTYSWNIMRQKWEDDCGLWVLNEINLKKYAESLKKIVGAVWELPAK